MRTWQWVVLAAVISVGLFGAGMFVGCASEDEPGGQNSVTQIPEARDALTEELMIPLAQAKNFHHMADVYLRDQNPEQAKVAVQQILTLEFPADAPEAEDVVNDARARLGKIYISLGDLDKAREVVQTGIDTASRESFFVANLHTVRGEILEARAKALDETDEEAAKQARRDAIDAFTTSNEIHERLLEQLAKEPAR